VGLLPKLKTPRIRLTQLNDDFGNTPEDAKKRMEAALPPSTENHRYESSAEFYGAVASGGRAFDWIKLQLKAQESRAAAKGSSDKPQSGAGMQPAARAASSNAQ
jgi:hypothetical protein